MGNNSSSVCEERKGSWSRRKVYACIRNPCSWEVWGEQKRATVQAQLWGVPWEKNSSATCNFLLEIWIQLQAMRSLRIAADAFYLFTRSCQRRPLGASIVFYTGTSCLCLSCLVAIKVDFVVPTRLLELTRRCYILNFLLSLQCQCSDVTCGGLTLGIFQLPTQLLSHSFSSMGQWGRK